MAKLSQLMSKSYKEVSEINTQFQDSQENRAEMRAKIFSRSNEINTNPQSSRTFDPKVSAEKLRKMQENDRLLEMYKNKLNDTNAISNSDSLAQKASNSSFGTPINVDNYESKILNRLDSTKRIFIDTINKLSETHPGLLYKNSTFGGIIMNPIDNINLLFNKLEGRIISVGSKLSNSLESKINPDMYDLVSNTNQISSKLNTITYNMNLDQMSELMTELIINTNIKYNFSTPDLLSIPKNSRPIVISDGNSLLNLYNNENLNFIFNTNYIDESYETRYGVVNYFKDTHSAGFIEKAREYNTFFKNLNQLEKITSVDYQINNDAFGFVTNAIEQYSYFNNSKNKQKRNDIGIIELNSNIKNNITQEYNVNYFPNTYANGFISNSTRLFSQYKRGSTGTPIGIIYGNKHEDIFITSDSTSILSNVDYFPNDHANGFLSNSIKLFSQYKKKDIEEPIGIVGNGVLGIFENFGIADYMPNTNVYGFTANAIKYYSYFNNSGNGDKRNDIGIIELNSNIKNNITKEFNTNYFIDQYSVGFISNPVELYSYYMDISRNKLGYDISNQAVMFGNRSSWLKVQNNLNDFYVDGFDTNSRFHYSYYKMKNGRRLGILDGNIVGFFNTEYQYPDVEFPNNNDYREYNWNVKYFSGNNQLPSEFGQLNVFPNLYNVGFIKNKEFGQSDFNNYKDNFKNTYSDSQISGLFETLDLIYKIGSSQYGDILAVDYMANTYARGFTFNSTNKYSYFQYKHGNTMSDIGFLADSLDGILNTNFIKGYGNVPSKYNSILAKFENFTEKYSSYKYKNDDYVVLGQNSKINIGTIRDDVFYLSVKSSVFSRINLNRTIDAETMTWKDYTSAKYPALNRTFNIYNGPSDLPVPKQENSLDDFEIDTYKKFIENSSNITYDLNRIPIYNFNTQNYIGVLRNTVINMKKAYDEYVKGDAGMLGKFSLTRGFYEPGYSKIYTAYENVYGKIINPNYKSMFDEPSNSTLVVIGSDGNGVLTSLQSPSVEITQTPDFISSAFELGSNISNAANNLLNAGIQGVSNTVMFTALSDIPGLSDFDKVNQSPLIFHTLAGHIYGATLASSIAGINFGSMVNRITGAVGAIAGGNARQATEELTNSLINQAVAGMAGGNVDRWLDTKSLIQMAQILLGDKYTKSYAFYDEELANNGQYGVPTPSSNINANTNIGFLGNREIGSNSYPDPENDTPGFFEGFGNIATNIGRLFGGVGVDDTKISNEGLKKRLNMRSGGTSVNLYDSENTYKQALYDQIDNPKDMSIMNDGFGRSRNTSVLTNVPNDNTDLIDFYFSIQNNKDTGNRYLHFRADIKSITNSVSAEWNPISYVGRPDKFYIYQGFERKGGVEFSIAPDNKDQFKVMWDKVNTLIGLCMPMKYSNDISMVPAIVKCKIGNYINNRYIVINSVNTNIESAYPWDIDDQLPQIIDISMDFTILYDELPQTYLNNSSAKWHIGKKLIN